MGKFFRETFDEVFGWIKPEGEFLRCLPMAHFQALPPEVKDDFACVLTCYDLAYSAGWVRVTSYFIGSRLYLEVYGTKTAFEDLEDQIIALAQASGAETTEWSEKDLPE